MRHENNCKQILYSCEQGIPPSYLYLQALLSLRWRQPVLPKPWHLSAKLHRITPQKTTVFVVTSVRTPKHTRDSLLFNLTDHQYGPKKLINLPNPETV
jgi:hypothetical protein